mgnify:FL=1
MIFLFLTTAGCFMTVKPKLFATKNSVISGVKNWNTWTILKNSLANVELGNIFKITAKKAFGIRAIIIIWKIKNNP